MTDPPDHLLVWLEAVQRRAAAELTSALDESVWAVGLRRVRILQLIPAAGLRQGLLAERAMISKQAMAEELEAMEEDGLVRRDPDPADGRARVVVRTARGHQVCEAMDTAMVTVERRLAHSLGADRYAALMAGLRDLGAGQI